VQKYYYDSLNRIDDATEDVTPTGGTAARTWRQDFSYDRYGNRSLNEANTTTIPRGCGTPPSLTVCTADRQKFNPAADPGSNKLSPGQGYSYDASGNTTADPRSLTFTYDGENKQVEVRDPSISTTGDPDANLIGRYWYDGDGKRVKKYAPPRGSDPGETTIFVYDAGGKQIAEYSTAVATQTQAKVSYLTSDHLGSPRINTDASGAVISRHDYHPFGEEISTTQRTGHPEYAGDRVRKQFTGYERDKETELDFAQARYYANNLGRFTTVDPYDIILQKQNPEKKDDSEEEFNQYLSVPQNWNKYSYTLNNPGNSIDEQGLKAEVTVQVDEKKKTGVIIIRATFAFYAGKGVSAEAASKAAEAIKANIAKGWNGTFEKDGIKFTVKADVSYVMASDQADGLTKNVMNVVGLNNGPATSGHDSETWSGLDSNNVDFGNWNINNLSKGTAEHEFGHLLNVRDRNLGGVLMNTNLLSMRSNYHATSRDYSWALADSVNANRLVNASSTSSRGNKFGLWSYSSTSAVTTFTIRLSKGGGR
jgi:RHS repeat-associated protein